MTDLSQTIDPKSDQINADDLIGGPRTIKVSRVSRASGDDQPIAINFEGDNGKPFKPCKSMRGVLVTAWGNNGESYAGKRMTLYRDDKVQFGGMAVGGIRISHMSDIDRELTMALTVTRAKRAAYTVRPLAAERAPEPSAPKAGRDQLFADARAAAARGSAALSAFREELPERADKALAPILADLERAANDADSSDDDFPGNDAIEGRAA